LEANTGLIRTLCVGNRTPPARALTDQAVRPGLGGSARDCHRDGVAVIGFGPYVKPTDGGFVTIRLQLAEI